MGHPFQSHQNSISSCHLVTTRLSPILQSLLTRDNFHPQTLASSAYDIWFTNGHDYDVRTALINSDYLPQETEKKRINFLHSLACAMNELIDGSLGLLRSKRFMRIF